jgi:hypothetical protein
MFFQHFRGETMTVVSAMKFNDKEGAIIADEQSSTQIRKYDIAEKIYSIEKDDRIVLFGGAGAADFLFNAKNDIDDLVGRRKFDSAKDIAGAISHVMAVLRKQHIDSYLRANYHVSLMDLQRGFKIDPDEGEVKLEKEYKQNVWNMLNLNKGLNEFVSGGFLILTAEQSGINIYVASSARDKVIPCARPYECIGSGSDMADAELSDFFDHLPREDRKSVDDTMGIAQLLHATERASKVNIGVGGTPYIVVIKDNNIITPSENNSRLANEMVKVWKKGCLAEDFVMSRLHSLIYANANYEQINKEMWDASKDPERMNMMLRGYKV